MRGDKRREDIDTLITSFEEFWKEYPRKVSKETARKKWLKLKPDEKLAYEIMQSLQLVKKSPQWVKDNGQFIPHPTTWLNQQRWNDVVESVQVTRKVVKI